MAVAAGVAEITSGAELRELPGDPMPRAIKLERHYGPRYASLLYG